jgi:hypothetical protein
MAALLFSLLISAILYVLAVCISAPGAHTISARCLLLWGSPAAMFCWALVCWVSGCVEKERGEMWNSRGPLKHKGKVVAVMIIHRRFALCIRKLAIALGTYDFSFLAAAVVVVVVWRCFAWFRNRRRR